MASPRTIRALILGTFLVPSAFAFPFENPPQTAPTSWYDQQLKLDEKLLAQHQHTGSRRDTVIAISYLDHIYSLRDYVSDAAAVDRVIQTIATSLPSAEVEREAASLLSPMPRHVNQPAESGADNELLNWAEAQTQDCELQDAAAEIAFFHHRNRPGLFENAAKSAGTAQAWYRLSETLSDDFQRAVALSQAAKLDPSFLPAQLGLSRRYSAHSQPTLARQVLQGLQLLYSGEPSVLVQLAQLEANSGHASEALKLLRSLRTESLSMNAGREMAEIYLQLGLLNEARNVTRQALLAHRAGVEERELLFRIDKQAGDLGYLRADYDLIGSAEPRPAAAPAEDSDEGDRQSQNLLNILHQKSPVATDPDTGYLVNVSEVLSKWRALPQSSRGESRTLADVRIETLRDNYQSVQHVQQLIAAGASATTYSERSIQYSPDTQQLLVLKARVHHATGRTSEGEDLGESSVADASVAMYYDVRARQYRFSDLRGGDVIELEYTISPLAKDNPYGNYFAQIVAFGSVLPTDLQRYVLRAPNSLRLSSAEHLVSPAAVHPSANETVSVWEKKDIAGLELEPRAPSWSEQGAYIHVSNFDSWDALGRWYAELIRPQFKLDRELESLASAIVAGHPNRIDRIAAIDDLVLKNTRYVALEFGVYGLKPYPVAQTYSRKFGDCKDKASLMVALLRAAGIEADLALVRTRHLGSFLDKPASVSIFDHAIVYVPEFDLWLDGTAEFSRLRELPVQDQGVMALTVDSQGKAALRMTPVSTASDNFSRRTINAAVEADGQIHFTGATYVRGDDAPELRRELDPRDAKINYVRERLAQVLPAVEVRHVELPQESPEAVALSFTGDLSVFQGKTSATLPSSWMRRDYVASLAESVTRSQDLLLDAPWTTEEEIHIQLPQGAHAPQVPSDEVIETEFGKATLTYRVEQREITVFSHVEFLQTRIPAARYGAFRDFAVQLENTFRRNITVELR